MFKHTHNTRSNIQVLPATQSTWSIYKKERSEVAASMALPGSIEIVRLGAQSGDLEFALDVIREFAWKNEDLTQIFIENDGVETILDLIRESEDRSVRFKACDTLGKLASKNDSVRGVRARSARIQMTPLSHIIPRMSNCITHFYITRKITRKATLNAHSNVTKT